MAPLSCAIHAHVKPDDRRTWDTRSDAGFSLDLTPGVIARALTHTDNAYWIPHFRATGYACKTNKQSNTAFRGFGGPQGVVVMEDALDRIARHLGRDANELRALNFYGAGRDETPYGQTVDERVKPQDPANQFGEGVTCETRTVSPRPGFGGRRELRDVLPYTVYRCEKNGIVYQGTQPPRTGRQWYPGVNPRVID